MDSSKRNLKNECVRDLGSGPQSNSESENQEAGSTSLNAVDATTADIDKDRDHELPQLEGNGIMSSPHVPRSPGATISDSNKDLSSHEQQDDGEGPQDSTAKEIQETGSGPGQQGLLSDDPHVLDPNNPLMVKFQLALTDLLTKQLTKLNDEIVELNYSLRKKGKEREDLGVNLFNLQEDVAQSQRQLESLNKTQSDLEETRNNLETELKKVRVIHKEESQKVAEIKNQEEKLRLEIEVLKGDENELKRWEAEYSSELAVSQRIADKTEKQKEERAIEKQKQDILLLRLRQAVLGLESRRDQLKAQREIKLKQKESLCKTIAEGSADLEALQKEQIRLTRVWNGVVVSLQQRDRVYNEVQKDLRKAKESFLLLLSEIDSYRKTALVEMQQNEKAMLILNRLESDYDDLQKVHDRNKDHISEMEADYVHTTGSIKQTEEILRATLTDSKVLTQQSAYQQRELERLTLQKLSLEMEILDHLQDQSKHDKAFQHLTRTIKSLKDSNKHQEMLFITMENQIAKTMVEVEKTRGTVVLNEKLIADANKDFEKYMSNLGQLEGAIKHGTTLMDSKMLVIDQLTKKLDSILARSGTSEESPQEARIKFIEMEIEEMSQECEKKQAFWLRLQSHIVHLTEERQTQMQQLNLLYKQIHILSQRALKIEHEIEKHEEGTKSLESQMHALSVTLNKITIGLFNKRGYKESLDKENIIKQTEALNLLKEMERAHIEQEEELVSIEENNLNLNQNILNLKQECLAWEKKIQFATEIKQINEEDKKADGELSQLKGEIQRMNIRYSQLRKFQENLVKDLEHCIMRREALIDQADAREKKSSGSLCTVSNRIVFERKLENLSTRTKQANTEARAINLRLETELPRKKKAIEDSLTISKASLKEVQDTLCISKRKLEDAQLLKIQKLELIVRHQKRVKFYNNIKEGKHKSLFRTESAMEAEMYRQRSINEDLINLTKLMEQHFPSLNLQCSRLTNTLQHQNVLN